MEIRTKLKPSRTLGMYQCPRCKGKGSIEFTDHSSFWLVMCPRCKGKRELDWVEVVTKGDCYDEVSLDTKQ